MKEHYRFWQQAADVLLLNRAIHQCNRAWGIQVCHTLQLFELMHFPDLILLKNMDYLFKILVDRISMLLSKIIDPLLVFQKENYLLLQDFVSALNLVAVTTHKTSAILMHTTHLQINTLFL